MRTGGRIASTMAVFLVGIVAALPAFGAGMNCERAKSPTETTVCGSADLRKYDAKLGTLYDELAAAQPKQLAALRDAQRKWLKTRDACAGSRDCIKPLYERRISDLRGQLFDAMAYQPDETDRQALQDLRVAVERESRTNPDMPLEKTLERLTIKDTETTFSNEDDMSQRSAHFPKEQPDGVSDDEWRALLASDVEITDGERGAADYSLRDIDGDGKRDLVIDWYAGGTGLFTYVATARREGARFVRMQRAQLPEDPVPDLYSIGERGGNEAANWIRLHGRMYVAFTFNRYGVSNVYLLNPLSQVGLVPTLTIRYRYSLFVPKAQGDVAKGDTTTLDDALYNALTKALEDSDPARTKKARSADQPLCPIPAGTKEDDSSRYYGYGMTPYTIEALRDMAVHVGSRCYIARLVDWFGTYSSKNGLEAELWMRAASDEDTFEPQQQFTVYGKRSIIDINTSISPVDDAT